MGEVIRFIPKSERERGRLIREARAIYDSIFPPSDPIGEPPADFAKYYAVLKDAQDQACDAAGPGPHARRVIPVALHQYRHDVLIRKWNDFGRVRCS